jgi:2-keto-4-pentenoate hydratase/2-oxohepta-3-ene-1,7-dioic acid hydratase in catechol pathway
VRLFSARLKTSPPRDTRILADNNDFFVDLNLIYATYLARVERTSNAYELADLVIPPTISCFLERGLYSLTALTKASHFIEEADFKALRGPSGERLVYRLDEFNVLPPIPSPDKTLVIGLSDQLDSIDKKLAAKVPTAFNKLASTFVSSGEIIVYPKFSQELDCDACLGVIIGKAGKRIAPEQAWDHIAGFTLLVDVTARDVSRRESVTRNNLLGKNARSSSPIGPSLWLKDSKEIMEELVIELAANENPQQKFRMRDLCFTVEEVISHWSTFGLKVGDIIALGASLALKSDRPQIPVPLKPGDTVRCFCPGIGELVNTVFLEEEVARNP